MATHNISNELKINLDGEIYCQLLEQDGGPITNVNGDFVFVNVNTGSYAYVPPNVLGFVEQADRSGVGCGGVPTGSNINSPQESAVNEVSENKDYASTSATAVAGNSTDDDIFHWTRSATLDLINIYGENKELFESSKKTRKQIWISIASAMQKRGWNVTHQQCDTKFKGLKKMFKVIRDHNNCSGKNRRTWEYYEVLNDILASKPEVSPLSTCSSASGFKSSDAAKTLTEDDDSMQSDPDTNDVTQKSQCRNRRKTKLTGISPDFLLQMHEAASKRHDDKMKRYDRFLDLLEKLVEQKK